MSKTIVTIGIPIYNAEPFLKYAIESVLNQSYQNWELILINDGSTDNSLNIIQKYKSDNRVHIINDGENKGLIYRLNQSIKLAKGEYYARMDADDIMHLSRIALQVSYLNNHREVDVVGSSYFSIDSNNCIVGKVTANPLPTNLNSVLKRGCFAHPSVMGRTEWFRKNQYDKSWVRMEDFELWIRTIPASNFRNIAEPLLFYRNIGLPTLQKYIKSNFGILKILQQRKKYHIGFRDSVYYSAIYLIKIVIYIFFFCLGRTNFVIKKRSIPLKETERLMAEKILSRSIQ